MSLGKRIRRLRQARGLTQAQLGSTDLSKSFISLLERGRAQPSLETLVLLARRLQTSVDALLGQEDHLHEMVCEGLLTLSEQAVRRRDAQTALRLLEPARFLATKYALEGVAREADLLEAELALQQRRFDEAWAKAEQVARMSEQVRDALRTGRALVIMGWVKIRTRDYVAARSILDRALAHLRIAKAGRDAVRVEALIAMANSLSHLGNLTGALHCYEEAAKSAIAQHRLSLRGQALWGMGWVHRKMGQFGPAARHLLAAKEAFEAAEELPDLMRVLHNLGQLLVAQGRLRESLRYFHHALRVMDRLGTRPDRAAIMSEIGKVHVRLGDLEDADHFASRALEDARSAGDPVGVAEAEVILARVAQRGGDTTTAIHLFKGALAIFRERQMRNWVTEVAGELGLLLREHNAHAEAATYLALALAEEGKEVPTAPE